MSKVSKSIDDLVAQVRKENTPGWWRVAQVVIGVVFVVAFAWSLLSSAGADRTVPVDTSMDEAVVTEMAEEYQQQRQDSEATENPSGAPDTPATGTKKVKGTDNRDRTVPAAAYDAALAAMAASFDPSKAASVPMAPGETFPTATTARPDAQLYNLRVSLSSSTAITFVAEGDPDGKGPQPSRYLTVTVLYDDSSGAWGVTNQ